MTDLVGQTIGRYTILRRVGGGGMAWVYLAHDQRLDCDVAFKVIRRELFGEEAMQRILARFEREARVLARLSHPNIVSVTDYGEHEGAPYLVMRYLSGGTLKDRLGRVFPAGEAARLLLPVARALDYAHGEGILHRDVKPGNILLSKTGEPVLSDFGIARLVEAGEGHTLTGTGVGIGTPEYMSPEQGIGKEIDARADLYSLGIVLYELVTGRKPYTAATPMEVVVKHLTEPLPDPRTFTPSLDEQTVGLVARALAKKPADRYNSLAEMAAVMEEIARGAPAPLPAARAGPPPAHQPEAEPPAPVPAGLVEVKAEQPPERRAAAAKPRVAEQTSAQPSPPRPALEEPRRGGPATPAEVQPGQADTRREAGPVVQGAQPRPLPDVARPLARALPDLETRDTGLAPLRPTQKKNRRSPVFQFLIVLFILLLLVLLAVGGGRYLDWKAKQGSPVDLEAARLDMPADLPYDRSRSIDLDGFANPKSGWTSLDHSQANFSYVLGESYKVTVKTQEWETWTSKRSYAADVIASVYVRPKSSPPDGYFGLTCRQVNGQNYYAFKIRQDGYYAIEKVIQGVSTWRVDWTASPAIPAPGEPMRLTIVCAASTLRLAVNQSVLVSLTDLTLNSAGRISLLAGTFNSPGMEVWFDDYIVYELNP